MTGAQQSIDSAIEEAERLRKLLHKSSTNQVQSDDERQVIKATAHAWFNNHRLSVVSALSDERLKDVDDDYRDLLAGSGRSTLRSKHLGKLKRIKKLLMQLQAEDVIKLAIEPAKPKPTTDVAPQFAPLVADVKMQAILANRWQECVKCVEVGAPLAATVMMGGVLEGLLLARINQLTDKNPVFKAASAPKDKNTGKALNLKDWGLKNYLDVAHELKWISQSAKDVGEVLRDYRNFIHPQKEHSHGVTVSTEDARLLWEVAKSVTRQVLGS